MPLVKTRFQRKGQRPLLFVDSQNQHGQQIRLSLFSSRAAQKSVYIHEAKHVDLCEKGPRAFAAAFEPPLISFASHLPGPCPGVHSIFPPMKFYLHCGTMSVQCSMMMVGQFFVWSFGGVVRGSTLARGSLGKDLTAWWPKVRPGGLMKLACSGYGLGNPEMASGNGMLGLENCLVTFQGPPQ